MYKLICANPECGKIFSRKFINKNTKKFFCSRRCKGTEHLPIGTIRVRKDANNKNRKFIYLPSHPHANNRMVIHARWIMEKKLRRFLKPNEIVHHIDENPMNDSITNLRVYKSKSDHQKAHNPYNTFHSYTDTPFVLSMLYEIFGINKIVVLPHERYDCDEMYGKPMKREKHRILND